MRPTQEPKSQLNISVRDLLKKELSSDLIDAILSFQDPQFESLFQNINAFPIITSLLETIFEMGIMNFISYGTILFIGTKQDKESADKAYSSLLVGLRAVKKPLNGSYPYSIKDKNYHQFYFSFLNTYPQHADLLGICSHILTKMNLMERFQEDFNADNRIYKSNFPNFCSILNQLYQTNQLTESTYNFLVTISFLLKTQENTRAFFRIISITEQAKIPEFNPNTVFNFTFAKESKVINELADAVEDLHRLHLLNKATYNFLLSKQFVKTLAEAVITLCPDGINVSDDHMDEDLTRLRSLHCEYLENTAKILAILNRYGIRESLLSGLREPFHAYKLAARRLKLVTHAEFDTIYRSPTYLPSLRLLLELHRLGIDEKIRTDIKKIYLSNEPAVKKRIKRIEKLSYNDIRKFTRALVLLRQAGLKNEYDDILLHISNPAYVLKWAKGFIMLSKNGKIKFNHLLEKFPRYAQPLAQLIIFFPNEKAEEILRQKKKHIFILARGLSLLAEEKRLEEKIPYKSEDQRRHQLFKEFLLKNAEYADLLAFIITRLPQSEIALFKKLDEILSATPRRIEPLHRGFKLFLVRNLPTQYQAILFNYPQHASLIALILEQLNNQKWLDPTFVSALDQCLKALIQAGIDDIPEVQSSLQKQCSWLKILAVVLPMAADKNVLNVSNYHQLLTSLETKEVQTKIRELFKTGSFDAQKCFAIFSELFKLDQELNTEN